jgi:thioredoxin-like negative regulator of GroEL
MKPLVTEIIYFGAPRCGPCRTLKPILAELAATYADRVHIVEVNADLEPDLAVQHDVRGLPTLTALRDGRRFDELRGFPGRRKVEEWFARVVQ